MFQRKIHISMWLFVVYCLFMSEPINHFFFQGKSDEINLETKKVSSLYGVSRLFKIPHFYDFFRSGHLPKFVIDY